MIKWWCKESDELAEKCDDFGDDFARCDNWRDDFTEKCDGYRVDSAEKNDDFGSNFAFLKVWG